MLKIEMAFRFAAFFKTYEDFQKVHVDVAQLVERWFVVPVVVGSSPIIHPI